MSAIQTAATDKTSKDPPEDARPSRWEDPNVPVGDSPPLAKWPLVIFGAAWVAWAVFLATMMFSRFEAHGG